MPSKTETAARRLVAELQKESAGRLNWWCSLSVITERASADAQAVYYAVQQHWVEVSPGQHSIMLREAGRRLG